MASTAVKKGTVSTFILQKKPREMTWNPLPQPWLPKSSGEISFPLVVNVVAAGTSGTTGGWGAPGGSGAVGATFTDEDIDSEDEGLLAVVY